MTTVLKIAVQDGLVMGSDSRSTLSRTDKHFQVFDGVKKLFVLHDSPSMALMTWGQNRINGVSLEQLLTPVTDRLTGRSTEHADWKIDPATVKLADVAEKVTNYLFHDHYQAQKKESTGRQNIHLHFAGYSAGERFPEHVEYKLTPDHIEGPTQSASPSVQVNYSGQYLAQILSGTSPGLLELLKKDGVEETLLKKAIGETGQVTLRNMIDGAMPLREVASLVRGLINSEIQLRQFGPEPDPVGGDIQMVVMNRLGCKEMQFKPVTFDIPNSVWRSGNR